VEGNALENILGRQEIECSCVYTFSLALTALKHSFTFISEAYNPSFAGRRSSALQT